MVQQEGGAITEQVAGGLEAGDQEEDQVGEQLVVRQPGAVAGVGQCADQVIAGGRRGAAIIWVR